MSVSIEGFLDPTPKRHGDLTLPVYVSEGGQKPIIVLHELPGMTPSFVDYCQRMRSEGFKVYAPLIFGAAGDEMGLCRIGGFCMSREFRQLFFPPDKSGGGSRFTSWLSRFAAEVGTENEGCKVGVIGMCLTGGFALVAFTAPQVNAVVSCQPAYPFFFDFRRLGLSDQQLEEASEAAGELTAPCAIGFRFRCDPACGGRHMRAVEKAFGAAFQRQPDLPGFGHSTLTGRSPNESVYRKVLTFLNERLAD